MIVNSYPYNPSQQQQQRCVGLNQNNKNGNNNNSNNINGTNHLTQEASMNHRLLNLSSVSQQNSLYGSSFDHHYHHQHQVAGQTTISHDLANLQFDSPLNPINDHHLSMNGQDLSTSSSSAASRNLMTNNNNKMPRLPAANHHQSDSANSQATNNTTTTTANNDMSLYSPSSSTSLLYHIYDQINLPNDQQQQQQQPYQQQTSDSTTNHNNKHLATSLNQNNQIDGKKNNTTILNPANLFSQQQQLPLQMQMHHQHNQLSQLAEIQKQQQQQQQQQYYSTYQQHPFSTLNPHHHHQPASSYLTSTGAAQQQQNNLMLDTVMRHQRLQRPLSSSAASSMSGQSIPAYGRHPRQSFIGTQSINNHNSNSKSQSNLANVLSGNANTLGHHLNHPHLIFGNSNLGDSNLRPPSLQNKNNSTKVGPQSANNCCCWLFNCGNGHFSGKQINQRARHLFYEYRTIVKCSLLLLVLALVLMSIIKLTLLSASNTTPSISSAATQTSSFHINSSPSSTSNNIFYPPPYHHNQKPDLSATLDGNPLLLNEPGTDEPQPRQDMLKSHILLGEFVILSQNFSQNPNLRTILAERIVKLMDQVFLSSPDVKQLYSRMEVTSIRPNQVGGGIIVNCNIILNESISYAAQQFGLALYNSLGNSRELLAGQTGYLIDKNSIKLNSVPDKDLDSGLVPPALIPTSLIQKFAPSQPVLYTTRAPSSGPTLDTPDSHHHHSSSGQESNSDQQQSNIANQVVWSEWSDWSSCVDKNGVCDPARLHSRLRRCVAQHTGDKVDPIQCKQRYSMEDQELEVSDCLRSCSASVEAAHIMSDAPSQLGPHTASPFLVDSGPFNSAMISALKPLAKDSSSQSSSLSSSSSSSLSSSSAKDQIDEPNVASSVASVTAQQHSTQASNGDQSKPNDQTNPNDASVSSTLMPPVQMVTLQQTNEISCSNCTSDEICLLLMQQKVPFCAKIKDRTDSCGGWCKGQNQLCQPVGSSAFKCIHDSECLPEEWRCHDSQCIPLSAHCDGHSNCFDNSDERDCPIRK